MRGVLLASGLLLFAGAALAADFAGSWKIVATIGGNPAAIECTLVPTLGADGKLAGTLHLGLMPVPFTATRQ